MILLLSAVFPPEPVVSANLSFDIASKLSINHKVIVATPVPTRPFGTIFTSSPQLILPFKHIVLNSLTFPKSNILGRVLESFSLGLQSYRFIKDNHDDIDVIYANTWPLFSQRFIARAANKYKIPLILHIHDIYPESLAEKQKPLLRSIINKILLPYDKNTLLKAQRIVTVSSKMKDYLSKSREIDKRKIDIVRNWQNDKMFLSYLEEQQKLENKSKFSFMYLGNLNPTAGVEVLINAFGKSKLSNCQLIIAGNGVTKDNCKKTAQKYHLSNIIFCEATEEAVPKIQAAADVLLLPLKKGVGRTALPSKLTAYLFSAKPVIASIDIDSEVADIILGNNCGIVVQPENEKQIILSMQKFSKMERSKLIKMGENGLLYAKKNLTI